MVASSETERLAALRALRVLDSPPEEIFDSLTRLAALSFKAPIALVSLVDQDRQWFKSCIGLDVRQTDRDVAFCDYAIRGERALVVPDATADQRFRNNPLVTGDPSIRFYAGAPLIGPDGDKFGTLCIIDVTARHDFGSEEIAQLEAMAQSVTAAMIMRRDISNHRALEREREAKAQLLSQAEALGGVGHWSWDVETDETIWSPVVYDVHGLDQGCSAPDLKGVLSLYAPDDADCLRGMVERALTTGQPYELQATIHRPDGSQRQVAARGACQVGADGTCIGLFGTFIDVTELKLADERTRLNEARLRFLTENASDVIMRVEPGRGVTWISPSCRTFGYEPEALLGFAWKDLIHPDDRDSVLAKQQARFASFADHEEGGEAFRIRHADGSWGWLEGNPTVIRDDAGNTVEIISVLRDVSAQRQLAADLERARDAAEEAANAKADFLANMSHEIRTPLTSILGFTRLLKARDDMDPTAASHVARVSAASDALLSIVNDVLDFSKLEAGQFAIEPRIVSPSEVIGDAIALFSLQAEDAGLALEFLGEDDLPAFVRLDPDRVRQILLNLVGNALKFTRRGAVRVMAAYDAGLQRLSVRVEDTGAGLTKSQQAKLFQRFSQVDGSSTRRYGGTGLGLAICKGLVDAMEGEVGVDSTPGGGATFYFSIPAAAITPETAEAWSGDGALRDLRILIVDDNNLNRDLGRVTLESLGGEVFEASDGLEALAAVARQPLDVILLDMRMPGVSGSEVLEQIRRSEGPNSDVPVLALTANADCADAARYQGFNGVVHKPIVRSELCAEILRVVTWIEPAGRAHQNVA